jgi:hypothetical protein
METGEFMDGDPPAAVAVVETDAFCDCGYNLHGQGVWRDERLGILVCRCPECGKHAAAGKFTGIHSAWLHRLSTLLVVIWAGYMVVLFLFLSGMSAAWPNMHFQYFLSYEPVPNSGPNPTQYIWTFHQLDTWGLQRAGFEVGFDLSLAAVNGLAIGMATAVFLWHLRWRAYLLVIPPMIVVGLLYWAWGAGMMEVTDAVRHWLAVRAAGYGVWEGFWLVVGIWIGRPVARMGLRLLLPERLLQHLAFLWYRDGKVVKK